MKRAMANSSLIMSASYLASLFEAKKTSYTACSTWSPMGDCKKSSTPDPTTLNALSRYKIHHGASNTWVSLSYSCHSMKKLARTCLLIESCMRKWIPNSLSSTNHLTIYLHKFFVKLPWTKNLSTFTRCAWKYAHNFFITICSAKASLFVKVYLSSAWTKALLT